MDLNNVAYNVDCMEYMRTLPDKAFDLAVVDPPYGGGFTEGGGCKGWFTRYRQDVNELPAERERAGTDSASGSTNTNKSWTVARETEVPRRKQKNHFVGRSAGTGLFRGTVPRLTQSDYMGW